MNVLKQINKEGVSIVIGARNEEKTLPMTVCSLMEDMYSSGITKFEFIIQDNGSDDETSRFFTWKPDDKGSRWHYIYSPRGIVSEDIMRVFFDPVFSNVGTRNKGVEHARYENIIFSDAHISVRSGTVKYIIETLIKNKGIVHAPIGWMGASCYNTSAGMQYSYKVGEKIFGCVDESTELLTTQGWLKYNEVKKGMTVPTINMDDHKIELQPIRDVSVWDYDGDLVHLENQNMDILATPDHRCIYRTISSGDWKIKHAEDIKTSDLLPIHTKGWEGSPVKKYEDAVVEVLGWVITDGFMADERCRTRRINVDGSTTIYTAIRKKGGIIQKKSFNCVTIENALKNAGFKYYKNVGKDGCTRFRIADKDSVYIDSLIPNKLPSFDFLFSLTKDQLGILWEAMMAGDGYRSKSDSVFYQVNPVTTDIFQALLTLMGKGFRKQTNQPEAFKGNHFGRNAINRIREKKAKYCVGACLNKRTEYYKGKVWCPNVENGTIFIRRNGKVMPTGNTWNKAKVADTPFYIPLCGHAFMAVKKDEFLEMKGYPLAQRVYGGGEPYLDTKYWMCGKTSMMDPRALVYHLSAGRGYSWKNPDLIHNMFLISYILGGKKWADRVLITYLNSERISEPYLRILYSEALVEGEEDKKWLDEHKTVEFEQVLGLDKEKLLREMTPEQKANLNEPWYCKKCTKRSSGDPHVMRPWDYLNEKLHGNHRSWVQEFLLRKDETGKVFIGNTEITNPKALEIAHNYL